MKEKVIGVGGGQMCVYTIQCEGWRVWTVVWVEGVDCGVGGGCGLWCGLWCGWRVWTVVWVEGVD